MPKPKADPKPDKKPEWRPPAYTPELWAKIIERLSSGEPLQQICRDAGMPSANAVYDWTDPDRRPDYIPEHLAGDFARARARGHDAIAADCLVIANTPEVGEEVTVKPDGAEEVRRGDMLGHRKLKIETRLKLLAKWDKRYADKIAVGGDADAPPIRTESTVTITAEEAYKRMLNGG